MSPDCSQSRAGLMALPVVELAVKPAHQAKGTRQPGCMRHRICQGCPKPDQIRLGSLHHLPPGLWGWSSKWHVKRECALAVSLQCLHRWLNTCLRSTTVPHVPDRLHKFQLDLLLALMDIGSGN